MREIDKWKKRLKYRKASKFVIIICFILSFFIIGLTLYGSNVGNFVISVAENVEVSMALADNKEFKNQTALLSAVGIEEMKDATLRDILDDDKVGNIDGSYNDDIDFRFMSYTFYAKNTSDIAIHYDVEIVITKVYKNVDSALRVMVVRTSDYPGNTVGETKIFAKPQETGGNIGEPEGNMNEQGISEYAVENFKSSTVVCRYSVVGFKIEETDKYTVVLWLEGYDPQCVDNIKGGIIKMEMKFAAY